MSQQYLRRLNQVKSDFDAADDALSYVSRNWDKNNISQEVSRSKLADFRKAQVGLETMFFIRLFATFEGILKQHLVERHSTLTLPEDPKAVWLIDRVGNLQRPRITLPLRVRVHDVRCYRNYLVHSGRHWMPQIVFIDALTGLGRFVSHLPEPY